MEGLNNGSTILDIIVQVGKGPVYYNTDLIPITRPPDVVTTSI